MAKPRVKKAALNLQQAESFFASQLFVLVLLERAIPQLDEATKDTAQNAMAVTAQTLDRLMADYPQFEQQAESIVASFQNKVATENV
jgi:hypothetical protein